MSVEPKEIIEEIKHLKKKIHGMDDRVKKYLSDRKRYPYPGHESMINEIHRFEGQIHGMRNSEIQFWLDGLMHSLMVHQRLWKQAFSRDDMTYLIGGRTPANDADNIPIDKIYNAARKKWTQMGVESKVTKEQLLDKIRPEYKKMTETLQTDEKISYAIDKKTKEIQVSVIKK